MYDIHVKDNLRAEAGLVVEVPEGDVDKKALYTLLNDMPDFLLPFSYRLVDGVCEFTYQVGNRTKMTYMSGPRNPTDYFDMWQGLIKPLIDCGDWFMKTFSFVLDYDHVYYDKNGKLLKYIYIPTVTDYSDFTSLRTMVMAVVKQNRVTDAVLENKVLLWALQDSTPQAFWDVMTTSKSAQENAIPPVLGSFHGGGDIQTPAPIAHISQPFVATMSSTSDNIVINAPSEKSSASKMQSIQAETNKGGFLGMLKRIPKKLTEDISSITMKSQPPKVQQLHEIPYSRDNENGVAVLNAIPPNSPRLRYIGSAPNPHVIDVIIPNDDGVFTIGRFDVNVGIKKSSFEFDSNAKAISRRHAAIEKTIDGYCLLDLNSATGTFINGQKLTPNTPSKIENGSRISFGNDGADYVWE